MHRRVRIESLESRVLLAANIPIRIMDGFEIATINWQGQQVDMFAGRWMIKLDGVAGTNQAQKAQAAQLVSQTDAAFEVKQFLADGIFLVSAPTQMQPAEVQSRLSRVPGYQYITPDFRYSVDVVPNDPLFANLWGLHNTGQTGGVADVDIDAPEAWNTNTGSSQTVIGGADTGIDYTHPDIAPNMWTNPGEIPGNFVDDDSNGYVDDVYGYDFFVNDNDPGPDAGGFHGTHTAGTAAARGNNSLGVTGVSWTSKLIALKIGAGGGISGAAGVAAMAYTYQLKTRVNNPVNVVVTNHSWGGSGYDASMDFYIGLHASANIITVCSAGNNASNNDLSPRYPSGYAQPNIIAVANMTSTGAREFSSNYGVNTVDLAAPGTDILSTIPVSDGSYAFLTGTSMSAPHVTGAVAVLAALAPSATYTQIRNAILNSVDPRPAFAGITVTGGSLNLNNAINQFAVPAAPATPDLVTGSDTGQFNNDNITRDDTPTFLMVGPTGMTAKIYSDGIQVASGVITAPNGVIQLTTSQLAHGVHNITATLTNTVGESTHSSPLAVNIDTVAPTVSSNSFNYLTSPHSLSVNFSEEVGWSVQDADFSVQNLDTLANVPVTGSYSPTTETLSFVGVPVLDDADYRLTVSSAGIQDVAGNNLVGLVDPTYDFFFMMADADHDRRVNLQDFNIVAANFGLSGRNFAQGDFTYDGTTNLSDFNVLAARFGTVLAAPQARPGALFGGTKITGRAADSGSDPLDDLLA